MLLSFLHLDFTLLPPSILWGWIIWVFLYRPFHHKMPWADKSIKLKSRDKDWK
jgi:hypothetical protein